MDFTQTGGLTPPRSYPGTIAPGSIPGSNPATVAQAAKVAAATAGVQAAKTKLINEGLYLDEDLAAMPVRLIQRYPWAAVGLAAAIGFTISRSPRITALLSDASATLVEQYMKQLRP